MIPTHAVVFIFLHRSGSEVLEEETWTIDTTASRAKKKGETERFLGGSEARAGVMFIRLAWLLALVQAECNLGGIRALFVRPARSRRLASPCHPGWLAHPPRLSSS